MDHSEAVAVGVINSRVAELCFTNQYGETQKYRGIRDFALNNHGKHLIDICNNSEMVLANHLVCDDKIFAGRPIKNPNWISETD